MERALTSHRRNFAVGTKSWLAITRYTRWPLLLSICKARFRFSCSSYWDTERETLSFFFSEKKTQNWIHLIWFNCIICKALSICQVHFLVAKKPEHKTSNIVTNSITTWTKEFCLSASVPFPVHRGSTSSFVLASIGQNCVTLPP